MPKVSVYGYNFDLELKLDPPVSQWKLTSKAGESGAIRYEDAGYILSMTVKQDENGAIVQFALTRQDSREFFIDHYSVTAFGDMNDVWRIWNPYYLGYLMDILTLNRNYPWDNDEGEGDTLRPGTSTFLPIATTERGIPILFAMNRRAVTTLAFGMIDQRIETMMRANLATHVPFGSLERGKMLFEMRRPIEGYRLGPISHHSDGFFISRGSHWFDTMREYERVHDRVMNRPVRPSPDPSWEPLWMPWAAKKGEWGRTQPMEVDEELILEAMKVGRRVGIKTVHALAYAWGYPTEYHDTLNTDWGWPDRVGDWTPHARFQDFHGTVRKLHEMGAWLTVWIEPFLAGRGTKTRETMKDALIDIAPQKNETKYGIATSYLCPRTPATQSHVVETMARVLRDYELDGLCLDMLDSIPMEPCIAKHEHNFSSAGLAMDYCLSRMSEAIRAVKSDAIYEFRQRYANINNLNYATAFRAVDSGDTGEFDYDRRQCVLLRSHVPSGVAVHADPLWWRIDEKDEMVSKMLSTIVMSGVPQFGVDLVNIRESHQNLMRKWLDFYQEHKLDFRYGTHRPVQNDPWFSTILIQHQDRSYISQSLYPAFEVDIGRYSRQIYLMNTGERDAVYTLLHGAKGRYTAEVYDHELSNIGHTDLQEKNNVLAVDLNIPQGGFTKLTRTS